MTFIKEKLEFLDFEKIKETEVTEKFCSDQELLELKKLYANLDEEQEVIDISDTSPVKRYNPSIKSNVYPEKDITLRVKISRKVDEIEDQRNAESGKLPSTQASTNKPAETKMSKV